MIEASRSRSYEEEGKTKSGRSRRLGLSRRARAVLGELYMARTLRQRGEDKISPSLDAQTIQLV